MHANDQFPDAEERRDDTDATAGRSGGPERPTATAPDSVPESVPSAQDRVGHVGPDAADPPRAGASDDERGDEGGDGHSALDPEEGADAFETPEQAEDKQRDSEAERQDEDHISLDTPD